ncbi:WD40 repeat domain-containing protein [Streptomyces sp. FH025]|nr:WD40 repeat domain-containing protein [Streptomyces sp. FH025]MBO1413107.1 WD40 repeat domain-containing protein [Streptomyces sp. FH025]
MLFTPGDRPVRALAGHLAALTGGGPRAVEAELAGDPPALAARLRDALDRLGADRLVVIVDQAEELFTQVAEKAERDRFVEALTRLAAPRGPDGRNPPALVVYGVRADFYGRFAEYPSLHAALETRQVFVGPLSDTELEEAITAPARSVGLSVEPGLVDVLLTDLGVDSLDGGRSGDDWTEEGAQRPRPWHGYDAGRLPLLAHALRATWRNRKGSTLTLAGYRASGGIRGAIESTAEDAYRGLGEDGRQAAEVIFRNLVRINEDAEDTRRALPVERAAEGADEAVAEAVLTAFTQGRLLTWNRSTVQITHEALLKAWPRLHRWLQTDRAGNLVRQQLKDAAAEWEGKHRDRSLLYRGNRLELALTSTGRPGTGADDLGVTVAAFLNASIRLKRRAAAVRRTAVALLAVLSVIAMASAKMAGEQKDRADQQRRVAVEQGNLARERLLQAQAENLRESDPQLSLQLSLAALRLHPTQESRSGLVRTLRESHLDGGSAPGAVGSSVDLAEFSGDGGMLAVARIREKGVVNLWDTTDIGQPRQLATLRGHADEVTAAVFSPDQRRLVTVAAPARGRDAKETPSGDDIILWDLTDRHNPRRTPFHADPGVRTRGAAISPDGRTLALLADGPNRTLTLWDIKDAEAPRRLGEPVAATQAESAVFSSDGRLLVTGSSSIEYADDSLTSGSITRGTGWQVWDVTNPAVPRATAEQRPAGGELAVSPTAPILAVDRGRTTTLWDLADPRAPRKLATLTNPGDVSALAFGPDGRSLVTSDSSGGSLLWDITDPANPRSRPPLVGSHGVVSAAGREIDQMTQAGKFHPIRSAAFNGDGRRIVLADDDGTLSRWTLDGRPAPTQAAALPGTYVAAAAFSPDGGRLVTGEWTGDARIWDVSDPARPRELAVLPGRADWSATAVSFNKDATVVAVGTHYGVTGAQGDVTLWDVSTPATPRKTATLALPSGAGSMAFSPTSGLLAVTGGTWSSDSWVGLWNTGVAGAPVRLKLIDRLGQAMSSSRPNVYSILLIHKPTVFSPDGRRLVLPESLWDVSDPAAPVQVPAADPTDPADPTASRIRPFGSSGGAAFSPDGRTLADGSDGGVKLWPLGAGIGPSATAVLPTTPDAGKTHVDFHPGGRLVAVGQGNGVVRLYEIADPALPGLALDLPDSSADLEDVRFSPDRKSLLVVRSSGSAQIWDLGALPAIAADPVGLACRIAGGGLSRQDWEITYATGLPYQDTCSRS